jgi:hypothetical protein
MAIVAKALARGQAAGTWNSTGTVNFPKVNGIFCAPGKNYESLLVQKKRPLFFSKIGWQPICNLPKAKIFSRGDDFGQPIQESSRENSNKAAGGWAPEQR